MLGPRHPGSGSDRAGVPVQIMTRREVDWVDTYHQEVWDKVSPRLQDQPDILEWLRVNTAPLDFKDSHLSKQPAEAVAHA